jgi:hypothetical protein
MPPRVAQMGSHVDLSPSESTRLDIPPGAQRVQVYNSSGHDLELTWCQAYGATGPTETPWVTLPAGQSLPVPALVPSPSAQSLAMANRAGGVPGPQRVWVAWLIPSACEW